MTLLNRSLSQATWSATTGRDEEDRNQTKKTSASRGKSNQILIPGRRLGGFGRQEFGAVVRSRSGRSGGSGFERVVLSA